MTKELFKNYKVTLLGGMGVGKSSIISRFLKDQWQLDIQSTIGASYHSIELKIKDKDLKFDVWDTAGQERYDSLAPLYYRTSHVIIVVFDIMNQLSFQKAKKYIDEIYQHYFDSEPKIYLIANKLDSFSIDNPSVCLIKHLEGKAYADLNNFNYMEVSAKDGLGIIELFYDIGNYLFEKRIKDKSPQTPPVDNLIIGRDIPTNEYTCC